MWSARYSSIQYVTSIGLFYKNGDFTWRVSDCEELVVVIHSQTTVLNLKFNNKRRCNVEIISLKTFNFPNIFGWSDYSNFQICSASNYLKVFLIVANLILQGSVFASRESGAIPMPEKLNVHSVGL